MKYVGLAIQMGQPAELFKYSFPAKYQLIILQNECSQKNIYSKNIYRGLINEIDIIQRMRSTLTSPIYYNPKFGDTVYTIINSMYKEKILSLIKDYGMITERKHGALFLKFYNIALPLFVNSDEDFEFLKNLLYPEVMKGNISSDYYAYFVDRYYYQYAKRGYQIYGSLGNLERGIPPIKDVKNIDKLRASIGACKLRSWLLLRKLPLKYLPPHYDK